jgi:predicted aminopeptidase
MYFKFHDFKTVRKKNKTKLENTIFCQHFTKSLILAKNQTYKKYKKISKKQFLNSQKITIRLIPESKFVLSFLFWGCVNIRSYIKKKTVI